MTAVSGVARFFVRSRHMPRCTRLDLLYCCLFLSRGKPEVHCALGFPSCFWFKTKFRDASSRRFLVPPLSTDMSLSTLASVTCLFAKNVWDAMRYTSREGPVKGVRLSVDAACDAPHEMPKQIFVGQRVWVHMNDHRQVQAEVGGDGCGEIPGAPTLKWMVVKCLNNNHYYVVGSFLQEGSSAEEAQFAVHLSTESDKGGYFAIQAPSRADVAMFKQYGRARKTDYVSVSPKTDAKQHTPRTFQIVREGQYPPVVSAATASAASSGFDPYSFFAAFIRATVGFGDVYSFGQHNCRKFAELFEGELIRGPQGEHRHAGLLDAAYAAWLEHERQQLASESGRGSAAFSLHPVLQPVSPSEVAAVNHARRNDADFSDYTALVTIMTAILHGDGELCFAPENRFQSKPSP